MPHLCVHERPEFRVPPDEAVGYQGIAPDHMTLGWKGSLEPAIPGPGKEPLNRRVVIDVYLP